MMMMMWGCGMQKVWKLNVSWQHKNLVKLTRKPFVNYFGGLLCEHRDRTFALWYLFAAIKQSAWETPTSEKGKKSSFMQKWEKHTQETFAHFSSSHSKNVFILLVSKFAFEEEILLGICFVLGSEIKNYCIRSEHIAESDPRQNPFALQKIIILLGALGRSGVLCRNGQIAGWRGERKANEMNKKKECELFRLQ